MVEESNRFRGVVTWFNDQKGYGFIKPDGGGEDLFVHQSSIISEGFRSLQEGQPVEFLTVLQGDKTKAVDVTGPNGAPVDSVRRDGGGGRGGRGGYGGYGFNRGSGMLGGGGNECYNCGEYGHLARDCDWNGGGGGGGGCFSCGGYGHLARDCPSSGGLGGSTGGGGGVGSCYGCGQPGHLARDCTRVGRSGGGSFGRFGGSKDGCYKCGNPGHFARECPDN